MSLGKISLFFFLISVNFFTLLNSEEKITTVPLVNLENLKPSFEKEDSEEKNILERKNLSLKEKKLLKQRIKLLRLI